jgi:hypothetical protein
MGQIGSAGPQSGHHYEGEGWLEAGSYMSGCTTETASAAYERTAAQQRRAAQQQHSAEQYQNSSRQGSAVFLLLLPCVSAGSQAGVLEASRWHKQFLS